MSIHKKHAIDVIHIKTGITKKPEKLQEDTQTAQWT